MPARTLPLDLDHAQDAFVTAMVESGRYASAAEVVGAGLRLLEQDDERAGALLAALRAGEESGDFREFDLDGFLAEMHRKHAA